VVRRISWCKTCVAKRIKTQIKTAKLESTTTLTGAEQPPQTVVASQSE